ncbi:MAG: NADH-quinone oxidoreductase subunit J [Alphaproteobacteria bacterium GM7ARS4]|nr:NADH-quinone oxidoreductase subunit J [Alphaproteobacteria bacterium GM7ARS4]
MVESLFFHVMACVAIVSSVVVVLARQPVISVLSLIMVFFNVAGLFILLRAEFLAVLLVIVYVGAIAVLFLFMVMVVGAGAETQHRRRYAFMPLAVVLAVVLLVTLVLFAAVSASQGERHAFTAPLVETTNTESLGLILYTTYMPLFQLAGLILLIAMVGAILLTWTQGGTQGGTHGGTRGGSHGESQTGRERQAQHIKRQDLVAQASEARKVRLVHVKTGSGAT